MNSLIQIDLHYCKQAFPMMCTISPNFHVYLSYFNLHSQLSLHIILILFTNYLRLFIVRQVNVQFISLWGLKLFFKKLIVEESGKKLKQL